MRILVALAAGLVVGTVLVESLLAGLLVLLPESLLRIHTAANEALAWPLLTIPALVWTAGGGACGAMATAISKRPGVGLAGGFLMAVAVFLLVNLTTPGSETGLLAALLPLTGSVAGALLAAHIVRADATVSATGQQV